MALKLRTPLWQDLTDREIAAARDAGALVAMPVGATEQHGAHLPADTDTASSFAVTRLAAERAVDVTVLVAPPLPFGFSPHHLSRPSTISLRLGTYLRVLRDAAESVIASGFRRMLFVNGHGGNSAPLRAAVTELVTDGLPVGSVDYWAPSEAIWAPMLSGGLKRAGHACEFETALALALRSADGHAVARIVAAKSGLPPRLTQPWVAGEGRDVISEAGAAWPPIFHADDCGYYGDPAAATAELGERLLDVVSAALARFFAAFAASDLRSGIRRDAVGVPDR
jgi:creatinine amidohydrolase